MEKIKRKNDNQKYRYNFLGRIKKQIDEEDAKKNFRKKQCDI